MKIRSKTSSFNKFKKNSVTLKLSKDNILKFSKAGDKGVRKDKLSREQGNTSAGQYALPKIIEKIIKKIGIGPALKKINEYDAAINPMQIKEAIKRTKFIKKQKTSEKLKKVSPSKNEATVIDRIILTNDIKIG